MNNTAKEKIMSEISELIDATDDALNNWTGDGNLQFPVLLGIIGTKQGWDERQARRADPFVREYVRNHPDWYVTRGAHGGIMKASDQQKKNAAKIAKETVKKQIQEVIDAKVKLMQAAKTPDVSKLSDDIPFDNDDRDEVDDLTDLNDE